nr:metallophosphoesterase [Nocardioides piscis]
MSPPPLLSRPVTIGLGACAGAGGLLATYAAWEARQYTLREVTVPLLPSGHRPLRVLHLSDIHLTPDQKAKQAWLRRLADLEPDLVIDTGDNLAHRHSVPVLLDSLGPLLDRPGISVFGSNDYFSPGFRNPLRYLFPTAASATSTPPSCRGASSSSASPTGVGSTSATSAARSPWARPHSRWPASTTHISAMTTSPPWQGRPTPAPTSGWGSRTRHTCGCSTSTPLTATTPSSRVTRTAARSAFPVAGH